MIWFFWMAVVVLVVLFAALTGFSPSGGKSVSGTRLMAVARYFLLLLAFVFLVLALTQP